MTRPEETFCGCGNAAHPYLGLLAQVGRELQAGDEASFISNNDYRVSRIKLHMCCFIFLPGHH